LGEITNKIVSALRQFKSTRKMALNTEIPGLEIYTPTRELAKRLEEIADDVAGTMQVREIKITSEKPELEERLISVEPNFAKLGPRLRGDLKIVAEALRRARPEELSEQLKRGFIEVGEAGKTIKLSIDELKITRVTERRGQRVEVIDLADPALTLLVSLGRLGEE
jgi:valyl-tRNA synthetase